MRRPAVAACAVLAVVAGGAGRARADAFDRIGEGAPLYLAARPVALVGALQRMGVDQLPSVQRIKRQMGGIDPFNPALLAAPGIDVAAPVVLSLMEPAGPGQTHSRVVATLRDKAVFGTFLDAIAASGQVKLTRIDAASPLGKQGVMATMSPAPDAVIILRVVESDAILDVVVAAEGKKAPAAAELTRRFAVKPGKAFTVGKGARRLFAPEAAAVVYVDGRRMQPLLMMLAANDAARQATLRGNAGHAAEAKSRERDRKCAALWSRAPTTFDDLGLALAATPEGLSLTWAWGTQGGTPLGGLKLHPVDDAGVDVDLVGRDATAMVALYAASLTPFSALKRSGPFVTQDALSSAIDGCDTLAGVTLIVRSWPLAIGALTAVKPGDAGGPMASLMGSFGNLRTVTLALRDLSQAGPRGAVTATFDAAARSMLELLMATGGSGTATKVGKRSPTVYALNVPGLPREVTGALETLTGGRVGFTLADSDESLGWAFRSGDAAGAVDIGGRGKPPVLRVAADMAELAKLGPTLNAGRDTQQVLDMLARLRRVDGELVADGDLFRLTLHSSLKQ